MAATLAPAPFLSGRSLERYTEGDCWQLAWALHEATGWPLVAVTLRCTTGAEAALGGWQHMVVRTPQGTYLDGEGLHSERRLLRQWPCNDCLVALEEPAEGLTEESYRGLLSELYPVDSWESRGHGVPGTLAPEEAAQVVLARYRALFS